MSATDAARQQALVTRGMNEMERVDRSIESSITASAAEAKAMVEARYVMALNNPRKWDVVRQNLIKECSNPEFANDPSAYYHKPIGKGVEGLGIRFAEVAIRCLTNVLSEAFTISEDDWKRTIKVLILDLESNASHSKTITVSKTVERSKPLSDGTYLSRRLNSEGRDVFIVPATDDDLLNKEAALISKALRTQTLRLVPGDLQAECKRIILDIRKKGITENPEAAKRSIIDAFARFGVKVTDLEDYLEHSLDQVTPAEILNLQALWGAFKDEEITSWKSVMENLDEVRKLTRKDRKGDDTSAKASGNAAAREQVEADKKKTAPSQPSKPAEDKKERKQPDSKKQEPKKQQEDPPPSVSEPDVEPDTVAEPVSDEDAGLVSDELPVETEGEVVEDQGSAETVITEESDDPINQPGVEHRGITFPKRLTWESEDEKYTDEQMERANKEAQRLNAKLAASVQSVLKVDLESLNHKAMEQFIAFLKTIVKK